MENIEITGHPLKRFEALIGTWDMTGRTLDADTDNITGWNTFEWLPGEFFIKSFGEIDFNGAHIYSLEMIGYDLESDTFTSSVYSNMDGNVLPYAWDVQGNVVTHSDSTSKYTGILSEDGNTLSGGWRPNEGQPEEPGSAYDAVMKRRLP